MIALVLASALAAAAPFFAHDDGEGWRLVAAYDAAPLLEATDASGYVWRVPRGMEGSCGPAKMPMGMGKFEAESVAQGLTPALVLLLERRGDATTLGPADVRVAVGSEEDSVRLEPMVEPRLLTVEISGTGLVTHKQLVRTQIEMELCLEHKVGRGWVGQDADSLRQAFLLDPPIDKRLDRLAFSGQRNPVPALVGPSDACLLRVPDLTQRETDEGQGRGTLDLVPSDIWGASLRWCMPEERDGIQANASPRMPLTLADPEGRPLVRPVPTWAALTVHVEPDASDDQARLTVEYKGETWLSDEVLFSETPSRKGDDELRGLTDILSTIPHTYPSIGTADDPDRYTALIVPNWQIVEALRRLSAGHPKLPMPTGGTDDLDGVGWVLAHPELLQLKVRSMGSRPDDWMALTGALEPGVLGRWGFAVGLLSGRSPIVLPSLTPPTWPEVARAQRALAQGLTMGAGGLMALLVLVGLRRLPELWLPIPEERADYWPGDADGAEEEGEPDAPEPSVVEGGE